LVPGLDDYLKFQQFLKNSLPCIKFHFMILNLSKRFAFSRERDEYTVEYLFTKETEAKLAGNIDLTLNISLNHAAATTIKVSKPTSVLYQSNELIEKMIEETIVLEKEK